MAQTTSLPQVLGTSICLILGAFILNVVLSRMLSPGPVRALCWVSFVTHFMCGVLLLIFLGLGSSDAEAYHEMASELAAHLAGDVQARPDLWEGKEGWVWLLAVSYALFTPTPLVGVAVNACFLALALCVSHRLTLEITGSLSTAQTSATLFFLVPGHWFWGSLPLREASVALCLSLVALYAHRVLRGSRARSWMALIATIAAMGAVRGSLAVLVAGALSLLFVTRIFHTRTTFGGRLMAGMTVASCAFLAVTAFDQVSGETSAARISVIRTSQSSQAVSGFETAESWADNSFELAVVGLPRVVLGPYPWEWPAVINLLPFAIFWWATVYLAVRGLAAHRSGAGRASWLMLVLPALAILTALAVYSGNYGTMIRLRDQALPLLIPLAAIGWNGQRSNRSPKIVTATRGIPHRTSRR